MDLHINALLDTTTGLSNADMLGFQMETFHRTLEENKNRKGQKIVFIHGKGEGVLKTEIEKQLKSRYKTYYFQDASFREYGFGATMVTIKWDNVSNKKSSSKLFELLFLFSFL